MPALLSQCEFTFLPHQTKSFEVCGPPPPLGPRDCKAGNAACSSRRQQRNGDRSGCESGGPQQVCHGQRRGAHGSKYQPQQGQQDKGSLRGLRLEYCCKSFVQARLPGVLHGLHATLWLSLFAGQTPNCMLSSVFECSQPSDGQYSQQSLQ